MANYTSTANVILSVNGKQAQKMLSQLEKDARRLEKQITKASLAGDKATMKKLQRELKSTQRMMDQLKGSSASVDSTLRRLDKATPKDLNKALKLKLLLTEIHEKAYFIACYLQIVDGLSLEDIVHLCDGFQFQDYFVINYEVCDIITLQALTMVMDIETFFTLERYAHLCHLNGQGFLIHLFEETTAEFLVNLIGCFEYLIGQLLIQ